MRRTSPRGALSILVLVGAMQVAAPAASSAQAWRLGPDRFSLRHPTLPSIQISSTTTDLPALTFYAAPDFSGTPVWILDERGLVIDGRLTCRWRDWAHGERLLEPAERAASDVPLDLACGAGLPIRTRVTDGGLGSPALFLAVSSVRSHVVELRVGRRAVYFDARMLPGREHGWSEAPQPAFGSASGQPGWSWLKSQRWKDGAEGAALAARLRDPAFSRFYHGLRGCLISRAPGCLLPYLAEDFAFSRWWGEEGDGGTSQPPLGRRAFARQVRQAATFGWREFWQDFAWCFLRGRFDDSASGLSFWRGFVGCTVVRKGGRYAIQSCDASD